MSDIHDLHKIHIQVTTDELFLNLLNHACSPVSTNLRTGPKTRNIKPNRNDSIPSSTHTLPYQSLHGFLPRRVHEIREEADLSSHG